MRRTLLVYVCVFALVGSVMLFPVVPAAPTPTDISTEVIGGRTWTTDIRVTRSNAQDHTAQITVDAGHDAHILWQSGRSPSGYYYVQMNRAGEFLSAETFITSRVLSSWGDQYPYGPTIDIDSQENLHVTFDGGDYQNVMYAKFDSQGNNLVPEKRVGPQDGASSHTPTLAVGLDDTVHIANEDYKFACEDIVYHKLDNSGGEIWTMRVVSSDVATHCEFDLIKASRYSGNFLFTFGSSTGTWLGRMDKFGVKNMPSVQIRSDSDYKIADVAETPNGDMHVVWFDPTPGKIYYTRVNASGFKMQNEILITPNAQNALMPRIASTSTGLAVVVWEDARNGAKDIYYAVIDNTLFGDNGAMVIPENIRLTNQGSDQTQPWIAVDPDDNFHVVWTDMRDGNQEIYYKFMFNFALELYADPIDIANLFFIHPNETKTLSMSLVNKGGLADSYTVDLTYSTGATQTGWRIDIDSTYIADLGADEVAQILLTVRAPANARQGDSVNMSVNASSTTAPNTWDTIDISTFVRVTRSLDLAVSGFSVKTADNGETISFPMVATNTGDVREDQINIYSGEALAPTGWVVTSDKPSLALDPREVGNFVVSITVPTDTALAPANFLARIGVTIVSAADPTVHAIKEVLVQVDASFLLELQPDFARQYANPGTSVQYRITVSNFGNLASQAQIVVEAQQPQDTSGWRVALDRETIYLRGGESTLVVLEVFVPQGALADSSLSLVVWAQATKFPTAGQTTVTTYVNRIYGLNFDVGAVPDIPTGRTAVFPVTVTNTGNGDETLQLYPGQHEAGWNMTFSQSSAEVQSVFVLHAQSLTFEVRVTTDSHAAAGVHTPTAVAIDAAGGQHVLPLPVRILQFFGLELTASEFRLAGSPAKTMQYDLELANRGNGADNFTLNVDGIAADAWRAHFQLVVSPELNLVVPAETVALSAGQSAQLRLLITVPRDTTATEVQFTARATSASGEQDSLILVALVRLADFRIERIDVSPSTPRAGELVAITLTIANRGDIEGSPVFVDFFDNGQPLSTERLERIAGGQRSFVTFAWLPKAGAHDLTFVVDPPYTDATSGIFEEHGYVIELSEEDNTETAHVDVGTRASFLPGFDGASAAAAAVAAGLLALASRRRRA